MRRRRRGRIVWQQQPYPLDDYRFPLDSWEEYLLRQRERWLVRCKNAQTERAYRTALYTVLDTCQRFRRDCW